MTPLAWTPIAAALALAGAAAWTDLRTGLIPNRLTLPALGLGLVLAALGYGPGALTRAVAGALVAALVPLALFRFRAMGGGDVKLFAALGALVGAGPALEAQFFAFFLGAVQGGICWLASRRLRERNPDPQAPRPRTEVRLGPAILGGAAITLALGLAG